jgi:hypothetical protein
VGIERQGRSAPNADSHAARTPRTTGHPRTPRQPHPAPASRYASPSGPRLAHCVVVGRKEAGNELGLALARLAVRVGGAAGREESWTYRLEAGSTAALEFLDEEPRSARLLLLEQPRRAEAWCVRRLRVALAPVLEASRGEVIVSCELARPSCALLAELLVAGAFSQLRSEFLRGRSHSLRALAPSLMSFVVLAYVGRGAARLDAAGNQRAGELRRADVVPLRATGMVVRTLGVVGRRPGLRSDQVAAAAGISSRGEASRVLRRLCERALIEDAAAGGRVRSWRITTYGQRMLELFENGLARAA